MNSNNKNMMVQANAIAKSKSYISKSISFECQILCKVEGI